MHHRKATESDETHIIRDSKTIDEYFSLYQNDSKIDWNKRLIFKNDKFLTLSIAHRYLQETGKAVTMAELIKVKGLPDSLIENSDFKSLVQRFSETYKVEFNPTSSVIGAIVSQEIVKVITQRDFPSHGLVVYDSITQRCLFE